MARQSFNIRGSSLSNIAQSGSTLSQSGAFPITLTSTAATNVTLPTSGTLATLANIGNGTLTLNVSGIGLTGSATFSANQTANTTFTVTSNATSANTANTIVSRGTSGEFSCGTINVSGDMDVIGGMIDRTGNISAPAGIVGVGVFIGSGAATHTDTSTAANATIATRVAVSANTPTFAATNTGVTITNAASLYVSNPPAAGTNVTITNSYAVWVNNGVSRFDSRIESQSTNNTASGAAQIYLNGATGNRIDWNTNGVAAPAFTTRSVGTKLNLFPQIAAASADYALGVETNAIWYSVPTTTQSHKWYAGTTNIATLSGAGVLTATDFNSVSDKKLKENVKTVNGLETITKLRGVEFDFIESKKHSSGVIAQEIETVLPHLVSDNNGTKVVAYQQLIAYLIESVKELKDEIDQLKCKKPSVKKISFEKCMEIHILNMNRFKI